MSQSFSPEDFVKTLSDGNLKDALILQGLVKQLKNDPSVLLFSEGAECAIWVTIPIDIIDKVEVLEVPPYRDHPHQLVRLHFKAPSATNREASVFAELLKMRVAVSSQPTTFTHGIARRFPGLMTGEWYCEKHAHCGDGSFQTGSAVSPLKSIAEAEAEREARDSCRNRGDVLSVGGGYCDLL